MGHTLEEYLSLIERIDDNTVELKCGFVPNMLVLNINSMTNIRHQQEFLSPKT